MVMKLNKRAVELQKREDFRPELKPSKNSFDKVSLSIAV